MSDATNAYVRVAIDDDSKRLFWANFQSYDDDAYSICSVDLDTGEDFRVAVSTHGGGGGLAGVPFTV